MARARTGRVTGTGTPRPGSGSAAVLKFMNRRLTVYRGMVVDEFGDESDVGTALYTAIPAAIAEISETVYDAATQRPQTIRAVKCRVPGWADIQASDTIQDELTAYFYIVLSLEAEPSVGYYPPFKILDLKMRSGITIASD